MYLFYGFPRSKRGNKSISMIVCYRTKVTHFSLVSIKRNSRTLVESYIQKIVHLHSNPTIISEGDPCFSSTFQKSLHEGMDTKLPHTLIYHPQTDGQTERVTHTIVDMLRACVLDGSCSWEYHFPLDEFI